MKTKELIAFLLTQEDNTEWEYAKKIGAGIEITPRDIQSLYETYK